MLSDAGQVGLDVVAAVIATVDVQRHPERVRAPTDARTAALARAWSLRARLGPSDRTVLQALAGPDYPLPSSLGDRYTALERAVALASDRGELWLELGDLLLHGGAILTQSDPLARAGAAFRRAIEVDSANASALAHLVPALAAEGDIASLAELQRAASPDPECRGTGTVPALANCTGSGRATTSLASSAMHWIQPRPPRPCAKWRPQRFSMGLAGRTLGEPWRSCNAEPGVVTRGPSSSPLGTRWRSCAASRSALAATVDLGDAQFGEEHLRLRVRTAGSHPGR